MDELFRPNEELGDVEELLAIAVVTEEDAIAAAEQWQNNPPDPDWDNVLLAE